MEVFHDRKGPETSYFASWKKWLPIMQAYEARKPMYFATPPVQLIYALNTALKQILARPLEERFADHQKGSSLVKDFVENKLGLKTIPHSRAASANGMTAIWLPESVKLPDLLPKIASKQVVFAGGLHKEIASISRFVVKLIVAKYFRIGHMGVSVTEKGRKDLQKSLEALESGLAEVGYSKH
jgi:alanine-glyoxylate transaminase / serine-glyoxylate transaminase / serine-pyruvate transaminase